MRSLGIRVTERVYALVKAAAEREHRSMSNWVQVAIEERLARDEHSKREPER